MKKYSISVDFFVDDGYTIVIKSANVVEAIASAVDLIGDEALESAIALRVREEE